MPFDSSKISGNDSSKISGNDRITDSLRQLLEASHEVKLDDLNKQIDSANKKRDTIEKTKDDISELYDNTKNIRSLKKNLFDTTILGRGRSIANMVSTNPSALGETYSTAFLPSESDIAETSLNFKIDSIASHFVMELGHNDNNGGAEVFPKDYVFVANDNITLWLSDENYDVSVNQNDTVKDFVTRLQAVLSNDNLFSAKIVESRDENGDLFDRIEIYANKAGIIKSDIEVYSDNDVLGIFGGAFADYDPDGVVDERRGQNGSVTFYPGTANEFTSYAEGDGRIKAPNGVELELHRITADGESITLNVLHDVDYDAEKIQTEILDKLNEVTKEITILRDENGGKYNDLLRQNDVTINGIVDILKRNGLSVEFLEDDTVGKNYRGLGIIENDAFEAVLKDKNSLRQVFISGVDVIKDPANIGDSGSLGFVKLNNILQEYYLNDDANKIEIVSNIGNNGALESVNVQINGNVHGEAVYDNNTKTLTFKGTLLNGLVLSYDATNATAGQQHRFELKNIHTGIIDLIENNNTILGQQTDYHKANIERDFDRSNTDVEKLETELEELTKKQKTEMFDFIRNLLTEQQRFLSIMSMFLDN